IGCLVVLFRVSLRNADDEIRRIRLSQVLFVSFALLILALELSPYGAVLQYYYYTSLMIPLAWLALAGQLAFLLRSPRVIPSGWLGGLIVTFAVLTASWRVQDPYVFPLSRLPGLLALLSGLGALIAFRRQAGTRSVVVLLLFVFASGAVAKQFGP